MSKTVVISGGTSGIGRATALARAARGDRVIVIGSRPDAPYRADLTTIAEVRRVAAEIARDHPVVDALVLCANRIFPRRTETPDGLEATFALYYLSRYLLGELLAPQLDAAGNPVIVNVSGTGITAGRVRWEDPQFTRGYGAIRAQVQAGRANDLLGVAHTGRARYVLYHPGFTRPGSHPNPLVSGVISGLARVAARPVDESARPIAAWIDAPPAAKLTAIDRGRPVPLSLRTLNPGDAARLRAYTEAAVARAAGRA
ncbi:SDR family NAD(P)-dependent oxidoreductase [Catenuloplanes atrovinosus]|uniref:NAD(P)-dependent dehydrogenase (Short-subunit alcohol dehydrogenase family) n=1 Tax=Catenuloplanes atrovinosus TaxID=137266 RepID=A0AAE4C7M1_9ACTN|nr:SDR family NAD(P)-dependent oxidoreductase [Catenuloplanes atrovinosus]MDR7273642.1 NAD(P)-dependent dehydrogenase (short-subunit alcohol dehydrogenase family) [Catenuloplanes atrovinosus]